MREFFDQNKERSIRYTFGIESKKNIFTQNSSHIHIVQQQKIERGKYKFKKSKSIFFKVFFLNCFASNRWIIAEMNLAGEVKTNSSVVRKKKNQRNTLPFEFLTPCYRRIRKCSQKFGTDSQWIISFSSHFRFYRRILGLWSLSFNLS